MIVPSGWSGAHADAVAVEHAIEVVEVRALVFELVERGAQRVGREPVLPIDVTGRDAEIEVGSAAIVTLAQARPMWLSLAHAACAVVAIIDVHAMTRSGGDRERRNLANHVGHGTAPRR